MAAVDYSRLAPLYDSLVSDVRDLPFFLAACRRAKGPVAELMAGSGRLAVPLVEAGIEMTCVDSSPEMLEALKHKLAAKGLLARVIHEDVTRFSVQDRFALIFIAFHSFEELLSDQQRVDCLSVVHRHLQPGGSFLCTLHDVELRRRALGKDKSFSFRFVEPRTNREVFLSLTAEYDASTGLVTGTQALSYAEEPTPFLQLPLQFRLIDPDAFRALATSAGFEVEEVLDGYSAENYREGSSATATWFLRKR